MTTVAQAEDDLYQRYDSTLLKFDGQVYLCRVDGDEFRLRYLHVPSGYPVHIVDAYDSRINTKSVELGYVNTDNGCPYVSRNPRRQYRQGVSIYDIEEILREWTYTINFDCTLNGIFPSVNEALNLILDGKFPQIAVTRDLMLSRRQTGEGIDVYFRETHVGGIDSPREDMTITFYSERQVWAMRPHLMDISWRLSDE